MPMVVRVYGVRVNNNGELLVRVDEYDHLIGMYSDSVEDPSTTAEKVCRAAGFEAAVLDVIEVAGTPSAGHQTLFLALARPADIPFAELPRMQRTLGRWLAPQYLIESGPEQQFRCWEQVAMCRLRDLVERHHGGLHLLRDEWTATEYRRVVEAVTGVDIDPSNFRKNVQRLARDGIIELTGTKRPTRTRSATVYRTRCPQDSRDSA